MSSTTWLPEGTVFVPTIPDVDFLAQLPVETRRNLPEMRRRLAAAAYVERERAKGHDRKQVIREAVKIYGPFPSVNFAEWARKGRHRKPVSKFNSKLKPPPPLDD
jgi:hypothetical protein